MLEETGTALLEVDGKHVGEVLSMRQSRLKSKQWSGVQFRKGRLSAECPEVAGHGRGLDSR